MTINQYMRLVDRLDDLVIEHRISIFICVSVRPNVCLCSAATAGTCSRQRSMSVLATRAAVTRGGSSHDSKLNAEQSSRKKTKLRLCTLAPHLSRNRTSGRLRAVMA